mgnify:CR=1 FL=1
MCVQELEQDIEQLDRLMAAVGGCESNETESEEQAVFEKMQAAEPQCVAGAVAQNRADAVATIFYTR